MLCGSDRPARKNVLCAIAPPAVQLVAVGLYALAYAFYLRRAFKDHAALPYCRYRLSNMCIRMQARRAPSSCRAAPCAGTSLASSALKAQPLNPEHKPPAPCLFTAPSLQVHHIP